MATMLSEIYDALREAGASEEKARQAAEAVAQQEERFRSLEQRLTETKNELEQRIIEIKHVLEQRLTRIEAQLSLVHWMLGTVIVLLPGVLWRLLSMKPA